MEFDLCVIIQMGFPYENRRYFCGGGVQSAYCPRYFSGINIAIWYMISFDHRLADFSIHLLTIRIQGKRFPYPDVEICPLQGV